MSISEDAKELDSFINEKVDIESVASFKGNEHIVKLKLTFDIEKIREALDKIKAGAEFKTAASGFHALAMTKRKNSSVDADKDLVGRYYTRVDESYQEIAKDELVDEASFSELVDIFKGTYFEVFITNSLRDTQLEESAFLKKIASTATPGTETPSLDFISQFIPTLARYL